MASGLNLNNSFLIALKECFKAYNAHGARSSKKLIPIHKWFGDVAEKLLGKGYEIAGLGRGGEKKLEGKYNDKDLDITVSKNKKIIATISFKFVTSNYKQNGNNYFENLCGETANIRRVNVGFAHFLVLRAKTPYYDKNSGGARGVLKKTETINNHDISKYIKLFKDNDFPHKPDVLGLVLIDLDDKKGIATFSDLNKTDISEENKKILREDFSVDKFFSRFTALCMLKG